MIRLSLFVENIGLEPMNSPDENRDALSMPELICYSLFFYFDNDTFIIICGEYRARTDDPLRARQVL